MLTFYTFVKQTAYPYSTRQITKTWAELVFAFNLLPCISQYSR